MARALLVRGEKRGTRCRTLKCDPGQAKCLVDVPELNLKEALARPEQACGSAR